MYTVSLHGKWVHFAVAIGIGLCCVDYCIDILSSSSSSCCCLIQTPFSFIFFFILDCLVSRGLGLKAMDTLMELIGTLSCPVATRNM